MIEDQRPGQTVLVNHTERRKNPRTTIRRLAYVNLEPYDNGGVITDISAGGLRFHMVNPVEQGGLVRLSVVLGAVNQLQIVGELIWMDQSRKIGGVRFTLLPDGAADQILQWAEAANSVDTFKPGATQRPASPAKPSQSSVEPNPRTAWVPPSARPPAVNPVAQMPSPHLPSARTEPRQHSANPGASGQTAIPPNMSPAMPWITYFDPDPPSRGSLFLRGVLGGFVIFALLGAGAWFALDYYAGQNGAIRFSVPFVSRPAATSPLASQPDLSPRPSEESPTPPSGRNVAPASEEAQSASPAVPPTAAPDAGSRPNAKLQAGAQAPLDSLAVPNPASAPGDSSSLQSKSPQTPGAGSTAPTTLRAERESPTPNPQPVAKPSASLPPATLDTGESQLKLARQYLDGHVQPRNPTVASQLLWSAVEKGNSAAEMDLANLYLHGDGVARNCDQARVLLSVASEKGNPEAAQKLRELNQTGCR